ncbi:MAG: FGGY family carbohydrate kinase, partial [Actinobacteria bacterium]|nr:FGGY family carbohydrate kinase [Actinomycetota bacterium]
MKNDYICGIDIGTTNIKGSVYTLKGKLISSNSIAYKSYSPEENYYEQKPDDWVCGLIDVLKKLLINDE